MEEQDEKQDNQDEESFYASEMQRLGLDVEISEPHLTEIDKLGKGGSGEVSESYDEILGRTVAVKTLHDDLKLQPKLVERMIREAQAAAQLEHPNIVPIYALGISPTKGVYFTMKRLRGDSLRHIITQLALGNPAYTWEYTPSRRLSIFIRICQGVSYAHSKGILHRDLKPENIRIGNYGEVTIIDWGLVREMVKKPSAEEHEKEKHGKNPTRKIGFSVTEYNLASKIISDSNPTMDGELSGTPRYMSPEQADAHNSDLDKRSDIYSLGVILYELLTCFNPFYDKKEEEAIINAVMHGNYPHPRQFATAKNVSVELEAICLKALELNKEMRYQTVDDMLRDIYAHQEGRQVQAYKGNIFTSTYKLFKRNPIRSTIFLSTILSIFIYMGIMHAIRSSQYNNVLRQVKNGISEAYALQEMMQNQLESKAGTLDMNSLTIKGLQSNIDNQLDMVTRLLSSIPVSHAMVLHYREQILLHRLRFDSKNLRLDEIKKDINLVSEFIGNDPHSYSPELSEAIHIAKNALYGVCTISNLDTVPYKSEVRILSMRLGDDGLMHGNGYLSLGEFSSKDGEDKATDSPNAPKDNAKNDAANEEQKVEQDLFVARTPLQSFDLEKGNYFIQLKSENGMELNLPMFLGHAESMDIVIKVPKAIPDGTVYVPEGKFIRGGANGGSESLPAFFIGKHEVTFEQYMEFWKTLKDPKLKNAFMAKIQFRPEDGLSNAWDENFNIKNGLTPELPVIGITQMAASAFCDWYGKKVGRECRLPTASEWEKAARGPDGRKYPWGDEFVPSFTFTIENATAASQFRHIAKGGSFKMDCSPYGAMDMAGNVREWTSSDFGDGTAFHLIKGASSATSSRYLPLFKSSEMPLVPTDIGFRILLPANDGDFSK